jgi:hypothetical protein
MVGTADALGRDSAVPCLAADGLGSEKAFQVSFAVAGLGTGGQPAADQLLGGGPRSGRRTNPGARTRHETHDDPAGQDPMIAVTRISTRIPGAPRAGTPVSVQIGARSPMRARSCSTMTRLWVSPMKPGVSGTW